MYQDGKRGFKGWNQQDDIDLMNLCDKLNNKNIKFAMSNVLENKGKVNKPLKEWCNKYNIYHLNMNFPKSHFYNKISYSFVVQL